MEHALDVKIIQTLELNVINLVLKTVIQEHAYKQMVHVIKGVLEIVLGVLNVKLVVLLIV
jgi:hypothetical protein